MTGRNYTNPHDRGRFGFSESGEYRAPYSFGTPLISVFIAVGAVAVVLALVYGQAFAHEEVEKNSGSAMFYAMVLAVIVLGTAGVCAFIIALVARYIKQGYACRYDANDEKFTLTVGREVHTIYYSEVQAVHFLPRLAFGKRVCGYNVTVKVNGVDEEYAIVFDGYLSEKNTPFNIIRERVEMLRNAEALERAREAGKNVAGESNRPISADDIAKAQAGKKDIYDRMAELLGKDAEMPGVSLAKEDRNTSRAVRAIRAEQEARAMNAPVIPEGIGEEYDVSRVMEKLSPTVGGYAADMPTLGKDGKVIRSGEPYFADDGREISIDDIQSCGTFHAPFSKKKTVILSIVASVFLAWFVTFTVFVLIITLRNIGALVAGIFTSPAFDAALLSAIVSLFIGLTLLKIVRLGDEYSYKANGREFIVSKKDRPDERILYKDAKGVSYKPKKFLWFDNGYEVEIVTVYGVVRFGYCYPRFKHAIPKEDLPFDIIRKNIERRGNAEKK